MDEDAVGFVINGFLKLPNCWKLSVLFPEKELEAFLVQANHLGSFSCSYQLGHEWRKPVFGGEGGVGGCNYQTLRFRPHCF